MKIKKYVALMMLAMGAITACGSPKGMKAVWGTRLKCHL